MHIHHEHNLPEVPYIFRLILFKAKSVPTHVISLRNFVYVTGWRNNKNSMIIILIIIDSLRTSFRKRHSNIEIQSWQKLRKENQKDEELEVGFVCIFKRFFFEERLHLRKWNFLFSDQFQQFYNNNNDDDESNEIVFETQLVF